MVASWCRKLQKTLCFISYGVALTSLAGHGVVSWKQTAELLRHWQTTLESTLVVSFGQALSHSNADGRNSWSMHEEADKYAVRPRGGLWTFRSLVHGGVATRAATSLCLSREESRTRAPCAANSCLSCRELASLAPSGVGAWLKTAGCCLDGCQESSSVTTHLGLRSVCVQPQGSWLLICASYWW